MASSFIPVADGQPSDSFSSYSSVSDGVYYTGLSKDDVGGIRYLLSTTNVALESVIQGVRGMGNTTNFVNRAMRPGVDKITFQQLDFNAALGQFTATTNQYIDQYVSNGVVQQQALERVISRPDILFTSKFGGINYEHMTGTTNWINNGLDGCEGPG
jgi:hypothetical protein